MESYDVLVVLLSITLLVSLLAWIVAAVLVIKLVKKIKSTSDSADEAVENIRAFTEKMRTVGDMSAFGSAITQIGKFIKEKRSK